ncbi:Uncharacterised protein [Mycobacteroides abscessus subsp. abscessus]|nr:Uncharacterised protein [Mycobacteroides abscessus subsp. abscessus]
MRAPTAKDGSAPAASSITAIIELVVVLPWVPATAIVRWTPMAAARASERCRTRSPRARAAASSGLDSRMAVEITTVSACSMFSAAWGTKTRAPFSRSASSTGPSLASEPDTLSPCSSSSSATADIPVPPMPMKCTRPSPDSCGRGGNGGFIDSGSRACSAVGSGVLIGSAPSGSATTRRPPARGGPSARRHRAPRGGSRRGSSAPGARGPGPAAGRGPGTSRG